MEFEFGAPDVIRYFMRAGAATWSQILVLIVPGLILVVVLHLVSNMIFRQTRDVIGLQKYLTAFGWFGIMIHELGHLLFCILFLQLISEVKLFTKHPADGKTFGKVVRANINTPVDNLRISSFFIGVGPIIFGALVIYLAGEILLGAEALTALQFPAIDESILVTGAGLQAFGKSVLDALNLALAYFLSRENLQSWQFYLFVYIAFSVASAMDLSGSDIETALFGIATFIFAIFVLNILTLWSGTLVQETVIDITAAISPLYTIMLFVLTMNIVVALFLLALYAVVSTARAAFKKR